ncbi:MAG: hypothetical protein QOI03_187, partial [Solirubrobacteraceae bacterium]|nr:hypothetical protein [Solirubrobacteraceae bacterium]
MRTDSASATFLQHTGRVAGATLRMDPERIRSEGPPADQGARMPSDVDQSAAGVPEAGGRSGDVARRLVAFYVILAAISVAVVIVVIAEGRNEKAQPVIAGGYDASAANPCLGSVPPPASGAPLPATAPTQARPAGPSFNLLQSGQFVNATNNQATLSGQLRLGTHPIAGGARRLTGTIDCVSGGKHLALDAVAVSGAKTSLSGTLGGVPFV